MTELSQYCAACECEQKPECQCSHSCGIEALPCEGCPDPGLPCKDCPAEQRVTPWVTPGEEYEVAPHVHDPAGPGEYCTGCFDQGAVWAEHEERARVRGIIEGMANDWHNRIPDEQPDWREAIDDLLAALDEGANDG